MFNVDVYLRITVPLTEWTVWEGVASPALQKLAVASAFFCALAVISFMVDRITEAIDRNRNRD